MEFARRFPWISVRFYDPTEDPIDQVGDLTAGADLVIVPEFNEPDIVGAVGFMRTRRKDFLLLFHDAHHPFSVVYPVWQSCRFLLAVRRS